MILEETAFNFVTGRPMPLVVMSKDLCDRDVSCGRYFMKSRIGSRQNQWDSELAQRINLRLDEKLRGLELVNEDIEEIARVSLEL